MRRACFSANLVRGIWQCFGCGAKGNVLDFALHMENLDPKVDANIRTVALRLKMEFVEIGKLPAAANSGTLKPAKPGTVRNKSSEVLINHPLDFELKGLQRDHPYFEQEGLSQETVACFGLGFCSRGLLKGRISIPLHDTLGQLVGYCGLKIDGTPDTDTNPRFLFPPRRERNGKVYEFQKEWLLYNAFRIGVPAEEMVITQDFTLAWKLRQCGHQNVEATLASTCSLEQVSVVKTLVRADCRLRVLGLKSELPESVFMQLGWNCFVGRLNFASEK